MGIRWLWLFWCFWFEWNYLIDCHWYQQQNENKIKYYPQCVHGPLEWSIVCWFHKTIINVTWYIFNEKLNKKDGWFFHPYKLQFVAYLMSFTRNLSFVFSAFLEKRDFSFSYIQLLFFWHFFLFNIEISGSKVSNRLDTQIQWHCKHITLP